MNHGDVVGVEIIVDIDLPVAVDNVVAAIGKVQSFELEFARLLGNVAEKFAKCPGSRIEVDEDELLPGFAAQRAMPMVERSKNSTPSISGVPIRRPSSV